MKKTGTAQKQQQRALPLLSEQVRQYLATCGQTRYLVARETGVAQSILSRFMAGETGLSSASLDALGKYLGLEVVMHGLEEAQHQEPDSEQGKGNRRARGRRDRGKGV